MFFTKYRRLPWLGVALSASMLSGCFFIEEYDEVHYDPAPTRLMYEVCYSDFECAGGEYCEDIAVPADRYTDFVNAICTFGCYDDLDCPFSEFNGLPGACIDHVYLGGPITSRICVERCEYDLDCDVAAGFGCERVAGERVCVPVL